MANLTVTSFNIRGGRDALKRYEIFEYLKLDLSDVCFLQESHTTSNDEHLWRIIWRGPAKFSHLDSNSGGVAILFNKRINVDILQTDKYCAWQSVARSS